jgi:hypothetical protein
MASKSSKAEGKTVETLAEFGRRLADRRAANPGVEAPRNSGQRRTASKRALLKAIKATGADW